MFFKNKKNIELYNTLLFLSRNIHLYKNLSLKDTFETRVYLMFVHFSIMLIIFKQKKDRTKNISISHSVNFLFIYFTRYLMVTIPFILVYK